MDVGDVEVSRDLGGADERKRIGGARGILSLGAEPSIVGAEAEAAERAWQETETLLPLDFDAADFAAFAHLLAREAIAGVFAVHHGRSGAEIKPGDRFPKRTDGDDPEGLQVVFGAEVEIIRRGDLQIRITVGDGARVVVDSAGREHGRGTGTGDGAIGGEAQHDVGCEAVVEVHAGEHVGVARGVFHDGGFREDAARRGELAGFAGVGGALGARAGHDVESAEGRATHQIRRIDVFRGTLAVGFDEDSGGVVVAGVFRIPRVEGLEEFRDVGLHGREHDAAAALMEEAVVDIDLGHGGGGLRAGVGPVAECGIAAEDPATELGARAGLEARLERQFVELAAGVEIEGVFLIARGVLIACDARVHVFRRIVEVHRVVHAEEGKFAHGAVVGKIDAVEAEDGREGLRVLVGRAVVADLRVEGPAVELIFHAAGNLAADANGFAERAAGVDAAIAGVGGVGRDVGAGAGAVDRDVILERA